MESERQFIGSSGPEDDVLNAIIDEFDGASRKEMKKFLLERGKTMDDGELDKLLQNLEGKGTIRKKTDTDGTVLYFLRAPGEEKEKMKN